MFDSALAFDRYRLEVVRTWPDSAVKDRLLASIECSLRRNGASPGHLDSLLLFASPTCLCNGSRRKTRGTFGGTPRVKEQAILSKDSKEGNSR
jgi:hypothetical protein